MGTDKGSGSFLAGFLLGGLFGAALALIFAPQPGEETVAKIREKGIELKERVSDMTPEEMKKAVREAIEEGKAAASHKKEELIAKIDQAKAHIEHTEESGEESIQLS